MVWKWKKTPLRRQHPRYSVLMLLLLDEKNSNGDSRRKIMLGTWIMSEQRLVWNCISAGLKKEIIVMKNNLPLPKAVMVAVVTHLYL